MKPRPLAGFHVLRPHYPLIGFLLFYLLFVLLTYRDFGVAWDEYDVYSRGGALFQYFFGQGFDPSYFLVNDSKADGWVLYDYWYPMLLFFLNRGFSLEYFHWLNFFFAALAFIAAYELLYFQYRKPLVALLGPVFLLLMPRFLGHIPIAPRDLAFAVTYFLALAALYILCKKTGAAKILVLGLLFGMAQASRTVGFSLYLVWALYHLYDWTLQAPADRRKPENRKKHFRFALAMCATLVVSLFFMTATWPYLAHGFFTRFLEILQAASRFPWKGDFLFMGHLVSADQLPWTYLPVWVLVSTPLFILFFLIGLPFFAKKMRQNRLLVFLCLALAVNLALAFLLKPVVYLGMRHFLYLLPILAVLAALSAGEFLLNFKNRAVYRTVVVLALVNIAVVAIQMASLHPYEYIYFNELTGGLKGAYGRYEIEDRGTSAKEAVEWLIKNKFTDSKKIYLVASYQDPFSTVYYLPPNANYEESPDKADFLITLPFSGKHWFKNNLLYSVTREGVPLMDIYEKKPLK
jgi:hypothetical protein